MPFLDGLYDYLHLFPSQNLLDYVLDCDNIFFSFCQYMQYWQKPVSAGRFKPWFKLDFWAEEMLNYTFLRFLAIIIKAVTIQTIQ